MMNLKKSDHHLNLSFPLQDSLNMSPPKPNIFSIKCPTHPRYDLTNICMSNGCIEPLCPECVKHHLKIHNDINSICKAETLFSMRETCVENVQNLLGEFINEKQRLHGWLDKKVFPHEEVLSKVKQAKENLLNMIYKFFEFIEKNMDSYVMNYKASHQEEFNHLSNKINSLINELQGMQIELNSGEYIKCMLKMLMQGFSTDLEILKKEISDAFEAWDNNSHNYEVDETKLYSINMELMKYIRARDDKPLAENKANNRQQNLGASDANRNRFNQEINKENYEAQERFKNFNNFLEYTMKSPAKLKKKQAGNEIMIGKVPNQREIMDPSNFARNNFPSSITIPLDFIPEPKVRFDAPNYFLEHSSSQLLCFFQENSKKFHFLELNSLERHDIKYKFQEKDLFIDFRIPLYHRSIAIPSGEIFMIGGIDPSNKTHAINKVYQLDLKTSSLLPKMSMGQARYSHSVCFAMKYIFTVGGVFEINEGYLNNFEKYDVDFGEWIPLTPSHIKSMGSSLCNFNDHFIYKFGGKIDNSGFSNSFERYDILKNVWSLFNIHSDSQILKFPSFANSYQINREEIMIYGGNINENQCKGIYLLRVKEFLKHEEIVLEEKIREIKMEINAPGSFWTQPLMHENVLFNTQNLQIDKGRELCHFGKKRVVICNSEIWKDL